MKFKYIFAFLLIAFSAFAYEEGGLSYRNMGFTQKPIVTFEGFGDFRAVKSSQEKEYEGNYLQDNTDYKTDPSKGTLNRHNDEIDFSNDFELHIKVNGINDLGVRYGAVVELEMYSGNNRYKDNNITAEQAYIFTESIFGKFEYGNTNGVSSRMKIGAETIARGAGGIGGDYLEYINMPMVTEDNNDYNINENPLFILIPAHLIGHGGYAKGYDSSSQTINECSNDGTINSKTEQYCMNADKLAFDSMENATKISYYSPRIAGVQFGISATPDTDNRGSVRSGSEYINDDPIQNEWVGLKNVIEYGFKYVNTFGNIGLALSYTSQNGESKDFDYTLDKINPTQEKESLSSTEYGFNLTYFGLTLAGSTGNWGQSLHNRIDVIDASDAGNSLEDSVYSTLGVAYEFGPLNFSYSSFQSEFYQFDGTDNFYKNEYSAQSFGVDYKLGRGFLPYLEVTKFEFEGDKKFDTDYKDNKGTVIVGGVLLNF